MHPFPPPSDQEISAAFAQGEKAVIALFQRWSDQMAARLQVVALEDHQAETAAPTAVRQGDIYWAALDAAGVKHPQVVVQDDVINRSRVQSVVVCALTTNRGRVNLPGNVLLDAGEANLPRQSVVEVSKVSIVEKTRLGEYIGTLTGQRVQQILAGMQFLQTFTDPGQKDQSV